MILKIHLTHSLILKMMNVSVVVASLPKKGASYSVDLWMKKDRFAAEVLTKKKIYAVIQLMIRDACAAVPI